LLLKTRITNGHHQVKEEKEKRVRFVKHREAKRVLSRQGASNCTANSTEEKMREKRAQRRGFSNTRSLEEREGAARKGKSEKISQSTLKLKSGGN